MGTEFKIAIRNLWRHKRRTLLTGIIIAVGLCFYIFLDSLMSGIDRGSTENMITLTESAVKMYTKAYDAEKRSLPLNFGISDYQGLTSYLKTVPGITGVTSRTKFLGEALANDRSLRIVGTVIDPVTDPTVFKLTDYIREGSSFSADSSNQIIIGKSLARDLELKTGETVTIQSRTRHSTFNAVDFTIVGLIDSTSPELNESSAIITYSAADGLLDLNRLVTEVDTAVPWPKGQDVSSYVKSLAKIRDQILTDHQELAVYTFSDLTGAFLELVKQKSAASNALVLLILLIAAVGIVNSVLMSVYERIREVGVLKAMGYNRRNIYWMFLYEGIMIGVLGSLIGLALGALVNIWLVYTGWDITSMMAKGASTAGFTYWGVMYGQWNPASFIGSFIFAVVLSILASIVPARKAARLEVTQCLRFV